MFLANTGSHHNTGYEEDYITKEVHDFISKNLVQGAPHSFMTSQQASTLLAAEANVLYDMMMNEAKQELQRGAHCFLSPGMNGYSSDSLANAALTQASNMPFPPDCYGCCNHSDPKCHAD
jgi:hypothetical protein